MVRLFDRAREYESFISSALENQTQVTSMDIEQIKNESKKHFPELRSYSENGTVTVPKEVEMFDMVFDILFKKMGFRKAETPKHDTSALALRLRYNPELANELKG